MLHGDGTREELSVWMLGVVCWVLSMFSRTFDVLDVPDVLGVSEVQMFSVFSVFFGILKRSNKVSSKMSQSESQPNINHLAMCGPLFLFYGFWI